MGSADPPGKMDEKLKSENMQKEQFSMFVLYLESNQDRQVQRTALCSPHIDSDILQNAPFRSQMFGIFFASVGKGALTPLTKILRTFLSLIKPQYTMLTTHASRSTAYGRRC